MDARSYAGRKGAGGAGMRRSAANAPVHGWAVPAPTPSTPSRKTQECEVDDPEGNLAIVERVVHENQRHFPDWAHGWVGTAHVRTSTRYGTLTSHVRHFPSINKHSIHQWLIKLKCSFNDRFPFSEEANAHLEQLNETVHHNDHNGPFCHPYLTAGRGLWYTFLRWAYCVH